MKSIQQRSQAGFSLIELLVAIVILSLGILGLSGLVHTSLKNTQVSLLRSQAAIYASDILERIRANAAKAADYALAKETDLDAIGTADLAGKDLREWLARVRRTLPEGDGEIQVTGTEIQVKLYWSEVAWGETGDPLATPKYEIKGGI